MKFQFSPHGAVSRSARSVAAFFLASASVLSLFTGFGTAKTVYVITDGDTITTVESYSADLDSAIARAGIELAPTDLISAKEDGSVSQVHITRSQPVTIQYDGATLSTLAYDETVGELLARLNITCGAYDLISMDVDRTVDHGMVISITRRDITLSTVTEPIPYATQRIADDSMAYGKEEVVQQGQDGVLSKVYRTETLEGSEPVTQLVREETTAQPVDRIVRYGTKVSTAHLSALSTSADVIVEKDEAAKTFTTASGSVFSYSRALTVTATAYTARSGAHTATGTTPKVGTVAVDPSVIPYGTKMYIVTTDGSVLYGVATAEDTGGSINGNRIDLYYDSASTCFSFGRRSCTVYLLN